MVCIAFLPTRVRAESKSPERSVRERERERRSREMGRNQQRANPINRTQSAAQVRAVYGDGGHDRDRDSDRDNDGVVCGENYRRL